MAQVGEGRYRDPLRHHEGAQCGMVQLLRGSTVARDRASRHCRCGSTLRPTLDQLWAQYGRKVFGDETRAQTLGALRRAKLSAAHTHILRYLAEKTNQVLRPSKPFPKPKRPSPPRANITALYQQPDGLETWSRRWDDLVAFLASNGPLTKEIAVAPTGEPYQDRDRGWTLLKVTVPPKGDTEPPRP